MAKRYRMHAIEYNLLMTLLKLLSDRMPYIMSEYNIDSNIEVLPSYPRDLTNMFKPSIIVRRVSTDQYKLGIGNVLGQLEEDGIYKDVSGIMHEVMVQFDVVANSNSQCTLLTSIVSEDIFNDIIVCDCGKFQLYDFTKDVNNPTKMGVVTITSEPNITYIPDSITRPNLNNDYISATRLVFTIVQEIIPKQEYIDLTKWIKIKQTIKTRR